MTQLLAGALVDRPPGPTYTASLAFAELSLRPPLPKPPTLRKQCSRLPEGFALSLVAPRFALAGDRGPLRTDAKLEEGVAWLSGAVRAVQPRFVVLPTPHDLTTGQRDRDLLAAYVDSARAWLGATRVVWAPTGLWEPDVAARFATKLGVICAFDPLEAAAPPGDVAYARLLAVGNRSRFGESVLADLVDLVMAWGAEDAYIAIDSQRSFREAVRLTAAAKGAELDEDDEDDEDEEQDDADGEEEDE